MSKNVESGDQEQSVHIPEKYVVLPLRNTVIFPRQVLPLSVGRESSLRLLEEVQRENLPVFLLNQREGGVANPKREDLYTIGTIGKILKVFNLPDGTKSILVQGLSRARVLSFVQFEPYITAIAQEVPEEKTDDVEVDALATAIKNTFRRIVELSSDLNEDQLSIVMNLEEPGAIADISTSLVSAGVREKQEILETISINERLRKVHNLLTAILQRLELGNKITSEVQEEIGKSQREFYLREQLKAINKELGEDTDNVDIKDLRKRAEAAKLPDEVRKTVEKELGRLSKMHYSSAEYTVARTYVEWLLDLPWLVSTEDNLDISAAQAILESDHYGLDKGKNRILEYLAVRKLKHEMRGPILCFVGPPGVGKTSLGRSIANALGRKFIRISLGGVHDEAEIRGHRRTYIGALPGRIIQGIKKAGSNSPVFMLDEVDKLGMDFRGDPSSALLEVLDPEQNATFRDHYLDVPFDLSRVLFITTANVMDTVPAPLRDRMEIINLAGYTEEEKIAIAQRHLVPKQAREHGLEPGTGIAFEPEALRLLARGYTREAGVRSLEREIASVCRKVARRHAEGKTEPVRVTPDVVVSFLGVPRFELEEVEQRTRVPGVVTGLAWTPAGGDVLFVEATRMRGARTLTLTGQLGDVMKESVQAALSWVRSHAGELGIDPEFWERSDVHVHVPAGAIPKDGPSAGVTMATALVPLLTGRPVRADLAMTRGIRLPGRRPPVGS